MYLAKWLIDTIEKNIPQEELDKLKAFYLSGNYDLQTALFTLIAQQKIRNSFRRLNVEEWDNVNFFITSTICSSESDLDVMKEWFGMEKIKNDAEFNFTSNISKAVFHLLNDNLSDQTKRSFAWYFPNNFPKTLWELFQGPWLSHCFGFKSTSVFGQVIYSFLMNNIHFETFAELIQPWEEI